MTIKHKSATGETTIKLSWTETKQLASGYGAEKIRELMIENIRRLKSELRNPRERLEQLRAELRAGRMSYGEQVELESLACYIEADDVELLEAAGVPEEAVQV